MNTTKRPPSKNRNIPLTPLQQQQIDELLLKAVDGNYPTLEQIGLIFGLTKMRMSQLQTQALNKLARNKSCMRQFKS
jgi:DNA-directed RNA polymerase sigma subunit (sigma70/sigma32)